MAQAAAAGRPVPPLLKKFCPHIYRQIVHDGKHPGLLSFWGRSVNVDENAGKVIVHPAILQGIGEVAGVPMQGPVVHAGLQHTYGYLFSLIDTPYGAKRDRWLSTAWERGFGIEPSLLSDRPKQGTLLANLTWFLGQIVYRGRSASLRRLGRNARAAAPQLVQYDYGRLRACRVAERVALAGRPKREVQLITDLVPFPFRAVSNAENFLLIYSARNGQRAPIRLITAFPVTSMVAQGIKTSAEQRGRVTVRLRYNAYVPGLLGRALMGRRYLAEPPAQN